MVFVTRGTFNVVCPRFPHRPPDRPTDHVVEATGVGLSWTPGSGVQQGQGQGQSRDERLSLGWLLNRNLKAILTSISLRVDDKTLHVSTSKSGVSIMGGIGIGHSGWKYISIQTSIQSRSLSVEKHCENGGFFQRSDSHSRCMPSCARKPSIRFVRPLANRSGGE